MWPRGTASVRSLHTRTTLSDGKLTPAENMQWHADHGYHFLAITDHNRVTDPLAFNASPPLLAIPSVKVSARRGEVEYHVVTLGVRSMSIVHHQSPQATTDAATSASDVGATTILTTRQVCCILCAMVYTKQPYSILYPS